MADHITPSEMLGISSNISCTCCKLHSQYIELVLAQFRRAKGRVKNADFELYEDLSALYNKSNDAPIDPTVMRRLSEKLQLMGIAQLSQESLVLHEMVADTGGDPDENIEKMSMLLKKIKDFVKTENPNMEALAIENHQLADSGQGFSDGNHKTRVIPIDFRCPISLELMNMIMYI